jgi:antitoxin CptB
MNQPLKKLGWQCRRGTQELDRLLLRYLQTDYPTASPQEQQLFQQLLTYEDPVLQTFLLTDKRPKESQFAQLIAKIRQSPYFYA